MSGRLVVVGTPIGNLDDLSPRATEALRGAAVVACEDTRRTGRLLSAVGISSPEYVVVNDHTETDAARGLAERIRGGAVVALVTDAGMPAVSDPGQAVVATVADAGLSIEVIPGPTAVSAALAGSGLPSGRWVFEGFLPRKESARHERLAEIAAERRTVVLYEAPHRVARTVDDLLGVCEPERRVALARELTKLHEEFVRGTLADARRWLDEHEPKGEFVVVLDGAAPAPDATDADIRAALAEQRDTGASTRDAVAAVTARFGVAKRRVYDLATGAGPLGDA
ncbi:MAG: 16S rRNA (cytidine(1402)-2'-O)-methyltransferase [Acidimicrobiales bacterium]|nr:16S rRNA (cytidine(1402)-2'-O)-methyltransferase [Acidimicrobiales bacterium]